MIKNPIQEVTNQLQSRAIGIVYGSYKPIDSGLIYKGNLLDVDGLALDCVVLGKSLPIIKKHINFEKNYFWVVYPRNKNTETLHIQIAGVWEPFFEKENSGEIIQEANAKLNSLNLSNNFFSIRGTLIFINTTQKELVIKVSISKNTTKPNNKPFKLTIKGVLPMDYLNSFISINAIRKGNSLHMDNFEIIENDFVKKI